MSKLALITILELHISYIIDIVTYSLKQQQPITTNYAILYTSPRELEREAICLAGLTGTSSVQVGRPYFHPDLDCVNPIGSVLLSLCYIFYDCRLEKLKDTCTYTYINKILFKVAQQAYD